MSGYPADLSGDGSASALFSAINAMDDLRFAVAGSGRLEPRPGLPALITLMRVVADSTTARSDCFRITELMTYDAV